jgi:hypothetical protein
MPGLTKYIGPKEEIFGIHVNRWVFIHQPQEILPGIHLLPIQEKPFPLPRDKRYLYVQQGNA